MNLSLGLHAIVLLFSLISIVISPDPLPLLPSIQVDLIDPSELTSAPNTTQTKRPEPAKLAPEPEAPPVVEAIEEPEPAAPPEPDPEPEPVIEPKKEPKPKKEAKKPKAQEAPKKDFSSVLKNLVPAETKTPPAVQAPVVNSEQLQGTAPTSAETLSISEIDLLRQQLAQCWNVPIGAMNAENLLVEVRVFLGLDNSVQRAEVLNSRSDPFFRAASEAARRAVLNPRCNPLALPPGTAERHRTVVLRFNPRDMF